MRFASIGSRQRRQRAGRRGRPHARADRLRVRRPRHRRAARRASASRPSRPRRDPRHARAFRSRRRRAPRSRRATTSRSGSRSARSTSVRRAHRRSCRACTGSIRTTRSPSATSRCAPSRCRTTRASRCSSSWATARRGSACSPTSASARRTSRRASPAATRWCSSATTTRRCSPAALSVSAQAAHRRPPRPPLQRCRGRAAARRSTPRGCAMWSRRTCRRRTTRPDLARAALAGALGCAPDWIGIADQATGFGWREVWAVDTTDAPAMARRAANKGNAMEKRNELYKGKAKTVYATDDPHRLVMHYRDDVSAFDGAKLAKLDRKGETNNLFNAYVMGRLAQAGIPSHFVRVLNERESLVRAMKMLPVECVVRNVVAGSMAKRYGIEEGTQAARADLRVLPQERRPARPAGQRGPHPRARMGERGRDRPDEGAHAQGERRAEAALRAPRASISSITSSSSGTRSTIRRARRPRRRVHAGRLPAVGREDRREDGQGPLPPRSRQRDRALPGSRAAHRRSNCPIERARPAARPDRQSPSVVPPIAGAPVAQISSKRLTSGLTAAGIDSSSVARGCSTW